MGDSTGDTRPDLAVFNNQTGCWTLRDGLTGTPRTERFGPTGTVRSDRS